ncbi:MAG: M20/M25/M40 family metallo-hydrolase [Patescibacteria group bacterium]
MKNRKGVDKKELTSLFLELVQIDSPTGEVEDFRQYLEDFFIKKGFRGGRDKYGNLIFKTLDFNPKNSLLLTSHIDTVQSGRGIKPIVEENIIRSEGDTILGADPKSGIASILYAINDSGAENLRDLEFIFSTNEEEGVHTLNYAEVSSGKALVLDHGAPVNEILAFSPFAYVFLIEVKGKRVYAQTDYSSGANAIEALCKMINSLPWGFYKKGCIANTGKIIGGEANTIVAPYASLEGNIYCFDKNDREEYIDRIRRTAKEVDKEFGTTTTVKLPEEYEGTYPDLNAKTFQTLKKIYQKNGVDINFSREFIISSNNCLATKKIDSVNIGLGYKKHHTWEEEISISQWSKFTDILMEFLFSEHMK